MPEAIMIEPEPGIAPELFGNRISVAREFAEQLGTRGEELGLIGPLEPPRLWSRHILNSVLVAPLLKPGLVGDIGTGAGLPGLVLAIARPDVSFVLIEPMERRVAWLEEQVAHLDLDNVTVRRPGHGTCRECLRKAHPADGASCQDGWGAGPDEGRECAARGRGR
jgi:16S rRNA (guanine527-N7)-methyltransferase